MFRFLLPLPLLFAFIVTVPAVIADDIDQVWYHYLTSPPDAAVKSAANLTERADKLAATLANVTLKITEPVDVVVSGGGSLDGYFMGGYMILGRLEKMGKFNVSRYAGASAGGMMPFEVLLRGEKSTLMNRLAYGYLEQKFPKDFANFNNAVEIEDRHLRITADWMMPTFAHRLSALDGRVALALSCRGPHSRIEKLVMVDKYTSAKQAEHAYIATGAFFEEYDGMVCSDGGYVTGPNMTPLFQDHVRDQMVVNLMRTGRPSSECCQINLAQYERLVEQGQDEMVKFLKEGTSHAGGITLCPAKSDVKSMVCKKA